jgi:hypothetical protein
VTAAEIVSRLCQPSYGDIPVPITAQRILKAQALATRSKIPWADVLAAMSAEQRAHVEGAQ